MELASFRNEYAPLIRAALERQLQPVAVPVLRAAMAHLVGRGKLFRPILALASCRALGGTDPRCYVALASTLELIHTFTLIHDDLPCMDDAARRRGVASVHAAHGEAVAVLAGDALQNLAIRWLVEEPAAIGAELRMQLVGCVTAAVHSVAEGQVLDLQGEGQDMTPAELQRLHRLKTGALLGACCEMGAWLGGGNATIAAAWREFGVRLGLAFQIRDDLLNVESSEAVMGKSLDADAAKQKATYPRLLGLAGAHQELDDVLAELESRLAGLNPAEPELLRGFIAWAGRRNN